METKMSTSQNLLHCFISKKQICEKLNLSRSTIERMVAEKRFPGPYPIGRRRIAWKLNEVEAWLNELQRQESAYSCRVRNANKKDN